MHETQSSAQKMDKMYRRMRYIYNATRKFYLFGRDTLILDLKPPPRGRVLEVGCGTGRNLIKIAKLYPYTRLFGIDISRVMLDTARQNINRAGLADRIVTGHGDACSFDSEIIFGIDCFDCVILSYALSMIPQRQAALLAAFNATAPSGSLHLVDFGGFEKFPAWIRKAIFLYLRQYSTFPLIDLPLTVPRVAQEQKIQISLQSILGGYAYYVIMKRPPFQLSNDTSALNRTPLH